MNRRGFLKGVIGISVAVPILASIEYKYRCVGFKMIPQKEVIRFMFERKKWNTIETKSFDVPMDHKISKRILRMKASEFAGCDIKFEKYSPAKYLS